MKGRLKSQKQRAFPFGATVLAKPVESSIAHPLESLCHVSYLGPVNALGGGMWGILTGPSKVGLVAEEALKLRKFQVARVLSPLSWDMDHLV